MNRHVPRQNRPPPLHTRIPQGQQSRISLEDTDRSNLLLLVVMAAYGRFPLSERRFQLRNGRLERSDPRFPLQEPLVSLRNVTGEFLCSLR